MLRSPEWQPCQLRANYFDQIQVNFSGPWENTLTLWQPL
jgi:hypothetical protein